MNNVYQNRVEIYHANRYVSDNDVEYFGIPHKIAGTIQSLNGSWLYLQQGFSTEGLAKFTISKNTCDWRENHSLTKFANGDRIWVETPVPIYTDFNAGENADYYIESVDETLNFIVMIFKRIT